MKKGKFEILSYGKLAFYCNGCKQYHAINIDKNKSPNWDFNNNYDKPTFSPSILVEIGHYPDLSDFCHSYVVNGKIQYLSDCTHEFAGKTLELEENEDDL